jgi:hypothetical protein
MQRVGLGGSWFIVENLHHSTFPIPIPIPSMNADGFTTAPRYAVLGGLQPLAPTTTTTKTPDAYH